MKFGSKLLSTFFDSVGSEAEPTTQENGSKPAVSNPYTAVMSPLSSPIVTNAGINQDMTNLLMTAIDEANLDGFDYLEFKQAVGKMMNIPMTEQQRFMTIFATAQSMGVTVEYLTNSVDHYVSVIEKQRDGFMKTAGHATQMEVDSRMTTIAENEQKIQEATQKINELTLFINQTQQANINLTQEASSEKLKIDGSVASFEATFNMVAGRLKEDKQKLVAYLGTQPTA